MWLPPAAAICPCSPPRCQTEGAVADQDEVQEPGALPVAVAIVGGPVDEEAHRVEGGDQCNELCDVADAQERAA